MYPRTAPLRYHLPGSSPPRPRPRPRSKPEQPPGSHDVTRLLCAAATALALYVNALVIVKRGADVAALAAWVSFTLWSVVAGVLAAANAADRTAAYAGTLPLFETLDAMQLLPRSRRCRRLRRVLAVGAARGFRLGRHDEYRGAAAAGDDEPTESWRRWKFPLPHLASLLAWATFFGAMCVGNYTFQYFQAIVATAFLVLVLYL